ncbi:Heterokaryon incompatibility [Akanthomyces lecanii RCEF 1005]|uniref:Heterokaryon incompatibility n=1 Tax=Akanthomyces lecanii RCEF 1005 TaxID=1081108 RepID=A0A168HC76_CORDF|nr:Heterokaryon incompatibility [Akanthomyces lecanii RCEF 1005]
MQESQPIPEQPPPYSSYTSGPDSYEYEPIEAGQIRLLSLLAADSFNEQLKCEITCYPISGPDRPAYTAVSYVWGAQISSHEVYCDGKLVVIGFNLDSALRHLRPRNRSVILWVDALCIDQSNVAERNHQVSLMRSIFRSAEETIVHLGDLGGNVSLSAWNFLERHSSWALNDDGERDSSRPAMLERSTEFRGDLHDVCHDVLCRDWFTRVWVFQEAVVSKTVSIQCGHRRIPWDDFVKATVLQARKHDLYGESLRQQYLFESVSRIWEARVAFQVLHHQEHNLPNWYRRLTLGEKKSTSTDILDMMVRARGLEATDPRDKIFALLGLSSGFDWVGLGTIDYGKSVAVVYTAFARDIMMTRNDYTALSYLGRKPSRGEKPWIASRVANIWSHQHPGSGESIKRTSGPHSVPSWVANWTQTHLRDHEPRAIIEVVAAATTMATQSPELTGVQRSADLRGERITDFRSWLPADVLAVHGRVLGMVGRTVKPAYLQGKDEMHFDELRKRWLKSKYSRQYPLEAYILARWEILLNARVGYFSHPPSASQVDPGSPSRRRARHLDMSVSGLLDRPPGAHRRGRRFRRSRKLKAFVDLQTCPPKPGSIEEHLVARGRKTVEWSDTSWPVESIVRDRSSIIDARLIGLFAKEDAEDTKARCVLLPETAEPGDVVVYFPGAKVPFLLRSCVDDGKAKQLYESKDYWKELAAGKLPHLNGSERFIWGHLLGECWINEFDKLACEEMKDGLFMII